MNHNQAGQSLIEVIVAATVGILVVTALTFATIFSLRNASFAKNSEQATKLAQEGIERVRTGRDRNSPIDIPATRVDSWNGIPGNAESAIWAYRISGNGLCDNTVTGGKCYFNVNSTGVLTNKGYGSTVFPPLAEGIPAANPVFKRAVLLSDDSNYQTQKIVTVIVRWSDFAGAHESKLTTILRKL